MTLYPRNHDVMSAEDEADGAGNACSNNSFGTASHSATPVSNDSSALSATALLIDSPSVLGPLPDPCRSPTYRKLSDPSGCGIQSPAGSSDAAAPQRQFSGRSRVGATTKTLSRGSLRSFSSSVRSYSGGQVPVLDSVSSLDGDAELGLLSGVSAAAGTVSVAVMLRHAAAAYAGMLSATATARHTNVSPVCLSITPWLGTGSCPSTTGIFELSTPTLRA